MQNLVQRVRDKRFFYLRRREAMNENGCMVHQCKAYKATSFKLTN